MKKNIELQLFFNQNESEEMKGLIGNFPEITIVKSENPLKADPATTGIIVTAISILIPLGIKGLKSLESFLNSYYRRNDNKSIELKDKTLNREIKIKGYSKSESQKILNQLLDKDNS